MVVLGGGAVPYERGTPRNARRSCDTHCVPHCDDTLDVLLVRCARACNIQTANLITKPTMGPQTGLSAGICFHETERETSRRAAGRAAVCSTVGVSSGSWWILVWDRASQLSEVKSTRASSASDVVGRHRGGGGAGVLCRDGV